MQSLILLFYLIKNKKQTQNEDSVGLTSHTKLTTYLVIRKNRSNNDKGSVS